MDEVLSTISIIVMILVIIFVVLHIVFDNEED